MVRLSEPFKALSPPRIASYFLARSKSNEDVCYGSLSVKEANFTSADDPDEVVVGVEFTVVKGCGVRAEIEAEQQKAREGEGAKYDAGRKCWTTSVVRQNDNENDENEHQSSTPLHGLVVDQG